MSDWGYLRVTLDIAIDLSRTEGRHIRKALLDGDAHSTEIGEAIRSGVIEVDGCSKVEDHGE